MQKAWSHQNDIAYMGSDGLYLTGWLAISTLWKNVVAMKLGGKVTPSNQHSIVGDNMVSTHALKWVPTRLTINLSRYRFNHLPLFGERMVYGRWSCTK
jgi:hypothetical protein